jgi:hypothetical protein
MPISTVLSSTPNALSSESLQSSRARRDVLYLFRSRSSLLPRWQDLFVFIFVASHLKSIAPTLCTRHSCLRVHSGPRIAGDGENDVIQGIRRPHKSESCMKSHHRNVCRGNRRAAARHPAPQSPRGAAYPFSGTNLMSKVSVF